MRKLKALLKASQVNFYAWDPDGAASKAWLDQAGLVVDGAGGLCGASRDRMLLYVQQHRLRVARGRRLGATRIWCCVGWSSLANIRKVVLHVAPPSILCAPRLTETSSTKSKASNGYLSNGYLSNGYLNSYLVVTNTARCYIQVYTSESLFPPFTVGGSTFSSLDAFLSL